MTLPYASEMRDKVIKAREEARQPLRKTVYAFVDEVVVPYIEEATNRGLTSVKIGKSELPTDFDDGYGIYHMTDFVEELIEMLKNYGYSFEDVGGYFLISW